ncbi:unnamed protein product [Menidia menidia]|uniref:(Atlantic silverside) hypothetical protein n=1 Tax=Menidia menidia TaxID=238744 RepID=A0A8S4ALZ3_9TELE|nr:unnamed protein product [Menidia menidia]
MDQEDPKTPQIKEEEEEGDIIEFTFGPIDVKSEDGEEEQPQSSEFLHNQTEEDRDSSPGQCLESDTEDKTLQSSETDVSEGHWDDSGEAQSGLNSGKDKDGLGDDVSQESEKLYSCTECGKTFNRKPCLLRHKRIHSGEKPFSCTVCEASFTWKHSYVQHMRIHTGEQPFSCPVCDRRRKRRIKSERQFDGDQLNFRVSAEKAVSDMSEVQQLVGLERQTPSAADERKDCCGIHQLLVVKEEFPPDQQRWSPRLDQEDVKPTQIKKEQEEADIIKFTHRGEGFRVFSDRRQRGKLGGEQ